MLILRPDHLIRKLLVIVGRTEKESKRKRYARKQPWQWCIEQTFLSILRNRFIRRIRFEIQKPPWRIISPLCEKIIRNKKTKKVWKINSLPFEIKINRRRKNYISKVNIEKFYSRIYFRTLKTHAQSRVELENIFFSQAVLRVKITLKGIHL